MVYDILATAKNQGEGSYNADGSPRPGFLGRIYWMTIGAILAVMTIFRVLSLLRQKYYLKRQKPPRSDSVPAKIVGAIVSTAREASLLQIPGFDIPWVHYTVEFPPVGDILMIMFYVMIVMLLLFSKINPYNAMNYETVAYRCGWVSISQISLIVILAARRNLVSVLTGISAQRLNLYHRWTARVLFLCVILHLAYFLKTWGVSNQIQYQVKNNIFAQKGFGAFGILCWIFISSFAPFRNMSYEFFVFQHIVTMIGFMVAVVIHAPNYAYHVVIPPLALFGLDRVLRLVWNLFINKAGLKPHQAALRVEPGAVVATIPTGLSWFPGQHMYLRFPNVSPLEQHPFTISTLPGDDMQFVIRSKAGFTKRLLKKASQLPEHEKMTLPVYLDGPYGETRDFKQFDTSVFVCAGIGASFCLPLAVDIIRNQQKTIARRLKFIWITKRFQDMELYAAQLTELLDCARTFYDRATGIDVVVEIFATCEDDCCGAVANCSGCCCDEVAISQGACCCAAGIEPQPKNELTQAQTALAQSSTLSPEYYDFVEAGYLRLKQGRPQPYQYNRRKKLGSDKSFYRLISPVISMAQGESGVCICGPRRFTRIVSNTVVDITDDRAVLRGTGNQAVYTHVEHFGL